MLELHGLEVFGYHGVLPEEARDGQVLLFDVELEVNEPAGDQVHDAVDYRDLAAAVEEVSNGRRYDLIETLAAAVAGLLVERFPTTRVRVRVRKPRPAGIAAEWAGATAERRS